MLIVAFKSGKAFAVPCKNGRVKTGHKAAYYLFSRNQEETKREKRAAYSMTTFSSIYASILHFFLLEELTFKQEPSLFTAILKDIVALGITFQVWKQ